MILLRFVWYWWIFLEIRHNSPSASQPTSDTFAHRVSYVTLSRVYIIQYNDIQTVFLWFHAWIMRNSILNALTKKSFECTEAWRLKYLNTTQKEQKTEKFSRKKFSKSFGFRSEALVQAKSVSISDKFSGCTVISGFRELNWVKIKAKSKWTKKKNWNWC